VLRAPPPLCCYVSLFDHQRHGSGPRELSLINATPAQPLVVVVFPPVLPCLTPIPQVSCGLCVRIHRISLRSPPTPLPPPLPGRRRRLRPPMTRPATPPWRSTDDTTASVCIRRRELELSNFPDAGQPLIPTPPRLRAVLGRDRFSILGHDPPCFVVAASLVASPRDVPVGRGAILLVAPHLAMLSVTSSSPSLLPAK